MARGGGVSRVLRMVVCQLKRSARKEANQIEIKDAERESQRQARELKKAFLQEEKKAIAMEKKAQFKETMTLATQAYKQRCMERKMLREKIINEELR